MPDEPGVAAPLRRAAALAVGAYLVLLVAGPRGHHLWRELVLQVTAIGLCAAFVWVLVAKERAHRAWRVPIAAWATFFGLGNVVGNAHVGDVPPEWSIVPSLVLYVVCYPFALAAVAMLLRGRLRGVRPGPAVDAAIGALAICAAFVSLVVPPAVETARAGGVPVLLVLAFPVCDAVVAALMVAGIAISGAERVSGWFALGVALFGSADWWYVIRISTQTWRTGTVADGVWVLGAAVVTLLAAPVPADADRPAGRTWSTAAVVVPFVAAVGALAILVAGTRRPLPTAGIALAVTALLAVLTRLATAYATERRHAQTQVLARTDELTGLANRRALYEGLDELFGDAPGAAPRHPFAVLIADLDGFKQVNDTLGHAAGDALLVDVAHRLRECVPAHALLARLGGDEFAVVVPAPGGDVRDAGEQVAHAVVRAVMSACAATGSGLDVSASVGVVCVRTEPAPADVLGRSEVLHRADVAMYAAKRSVRRVVTDDPAGARPDTDEPAPAPAARAAAPVRPAEGSRPTRA